MDEPRSVEVPPSALSDEALTGLIEEFVTRAGTDYGAVERTLVEKVADIRRRLARGEATIVYDPETATANIVVAHPRRAGERAEGVEAGDRDPERLSRR
ncbi:MAG: YheU family protein [Deltaproteobacteria bacterium]|nr:YheU family protein [Deltaproteobacteria bacterium]